MPGILQLINKTQYTKHRTVRKFYKPKIHKPPKLSLEERLAAADKLAGDSYGRRLKLDVYKPVETSITDLRAFGFMPGESVVETFKEVSKKPSKPIHPNTRKYFEMRKEIFRRAKAKSAAAKNKSGQEKIGSNIL